MLKVRTSLSFWSHKPWLINYAQTNYNNRHEQGSSHFLDSSYCVFSALDFIRKLYSYFHVFLNEHNSMCSRTFQIMFAVYLSTHDL